MIELEQWGGAATLSRWAGVPPTQFFENELTKILYQKLVWYVINRRNRITGRLYKDEPSIFGWELGNELFSPMCDDLRPPHCGRQTSLKDFAAVPVAWTRHMAAFIRGLDANHLIISGGYIKDGADLSVADVDLLGGSYYSANTAQLERDIATVNGQRPVIVKEFGLAGDSNLTVVNTTLQFVASAPGIAGGLYWSLRGHAEEGGFYWHYEALFDGGEMTYPQSLHWPGFDNSAPTYESEVLGLLTAATAEWDRTLVSTVNETVETFIPCQPKVFVIDQEAFPPCLGFIGATGAARYEVWMRHVSLIESDGEWFRAMGDAHDAVAERMGRITFADGDAVRSLMAYFGTTEPYQFCFQSCSAAGLCSACSVPLTLSLNASGTPSKLCNGTAVGVGPRNEDAQQLGALLLGLSPPEPIEMLEVVLWCLAAVSALAVAASLHESIVKWMAAVRHRSVSAKELTPLNEQTGSVCSISNSSEASADTPAIGLRVLYVLATLLILFDARYTDMTAGTDLSAGTDVSAGTEPKGAGATGAAPLLFVVFGFEMFAKHAEVKDGAAISASGFASWHIARCAPGVVLASLLGLGLTPEQYLTGEYFLLPLGLSAWVPSLWNNEANSLVWIAGAYVFNSLCFLPLRDAVVRLRPSIRTRLGLLLCCWIATGTPRAPSSPPQPPQPTQPQPPRPLYYDCDTRAISTHPGWRARLQRGKRSITSACACFSSTASLRPFTFAPTPLPSSPASW